MTVGGLDAHGAGCDGDVHTADDTFGLIGSRSTQGSAYRLCKRHGDACCRIDDR